jgi:transposase
MNDREQRGIIIAAKSRIKQKDGVWLVPSQSGNARYTVCPDATNPHCTCPDHETRGVKCKHIYAVEYVIQREENEDGTTTVTETLTTVETHRKTYPQNWPAYNAAQTHEKSHFQDLLRDLCLGIREPARDKTGRKPFPLADGIFAAVFKVYSTVSGRRFMSDFRDSHAKGYFRRLPCYNSIFKVFEAESTFALLQSLVIETANPLKAIETNFACDSSGFSGSRFDRWFDHKWGEHRFARAWVKAHIMTGVSTNVITAVEIHGNEANDGAQLKPMLATTRERFNIAEVSADKAYISRSNLQAVVDAGGTPYIPFKINAAPLHPGLWNKMFHFFHLNRDEFLSRYHQRSNVESTFSMLKAKFGDGVRSKTDIAMKNEVLAKIVCHNICCLISAMYELGVTSTFWQGQAAS